MNVYDEVNNLARALRESKEYKDYKEAKEDVIPFIKDIDSLNLWNQDFFISITEDLT